MARAPYWNHNVHYQPVILGAVPPRCSAALDVGCGDGLLACRLAERCTEVTGIDQDERMIALARARADAQRQAHGAGQEPAPGRVAFVAGDFLACPLPEASFDFACANTSLHHMDFAAALTAMVRVLRPGGGLAVIGLALNGPIADYLPDAPAIPVNLLYRARYGEGGPGAPVKDPDMTWAQVRATASRLLPGVRYRRHLLWRYSLLWRKPA
jgi:SAM-dependent methyltransferase